MFKTEFFIDRFKMLYFSYTLIRMIYLELKNKRIQNTIIFKYYNL